MAAIFDLTGKTVLVTGGNGGIGLGFAQGCARFGADIVVWGRNPEKNRNAEETLKALGARKVISESVDVRDEKAVIDGMARAVDATGRLDCLFANAGIHSKAPSFMELSSEMYHELLAAKLHGGFYVLREAARHMHKRAEAGDPGGSIVVCGSLSIFAGRKGQEHYGAANGALASMVKGIATELGPYGVRANMIALGAIRTDLAINSVPSSAWDEAVRQVSAITPMRRFGEIDDIEGLAVYFASDASSFHTGDVVVLDGGRLANTM